MRTGKCSAGISKNRAGFSLLEMLVAIFVFSIAIAAASTSFVSFFNAQKKSKLIQQNMEDARYGMELMAKVIRMGSVVGPSGVTDAMYIFNNSQGTCLSYRFNGKLETSSALPANLIDPDCATATYPAYSTMTNAITSGQFEVTPSALGTEMGKVVISAVAGSGSNAVTMQTAVSLRGYKDVGY